MSFKHYVEDVEDKLHRNIEYEAYRDGVDTEEAASPSLARVFGRLQHVTNPQRGRDVARDRRLRGAASKEIAREAGLPSCPVE